MIPKEVTNGYVSEKRFFSKARHSLMETYGFISHSEWKSITYPELCILLDEIREMVKEKNNQIRESQKKKRRK